jgi:hypothetical protein
VAGRHVVRVQPIPEINEWGVRHRRHRLRSRLRRRLSESDTVSTSPRNKRASGPQSPFHVCVPLTCSTDPDRFCA